VLPGGTAHISDVGMCGSLDSCLGVAFDIIISRWKTGQASRNVLESQGRLQFNAVLTKFDEASGRAISIEHIRRIID
jgi:calcineurin-like phosphoesterase